MNANEITAADNMIAKITDHMEKGTAVRQVGKGENKLAIKDAKDARAAIVQAEAVLLDFYKSSGSVPKESWELLQPGVTLPAKPSTREASYNGVSDPTAQQAGILTVLGTISADFATMEADTLAQEETDQRAYQEDMKSSEIKQAGRAKEPEMKLQGKQSQSL